MNQTITRAQAIALLSGISHPSPVGFTALTDAQARKTGCPFAGIFKLSVCHPMTAVNYERMVNNQLAREGKPAEFVAQRAGYRRISPALGLWESTGNYVLPVAFSSQLKQARRPVYLVRRTAGGPLEVVSKETVAPWIAKPAPAATQARAGVENEVVWRTYGIGSLVRLSIGGKVYRLRD